MDKTELVKAVSNLFAISGYKVSTSVDINSREIDVVAEETQGLVRKTVLIECANYSSNVGPDKLDTDLRKLLMAKEKLGHRAVLMHVSSVGYTQKARGYALEHGLDLYTLKELSARLVNFDPYLEAISNDKSRQVIIKEYQPTKIHMEGETESGTKAMEFLDGWLANGSRWLTVLGDYGVGKSWMLKRYLFQLADRFKEDPLGRPLPFFVPLQRFTKAFDYRNLILSTFQLYGLTGVHYSAFEHMAVNGRIVFLYDSFDEMAQTLRADTIRDNLRELLGAVSGNSRAIMTSRPTYFESRAERLLVSEDEFARHPIDKRTLVNRSAISRFIQDSLSNSSFARLNDLTPQQRRKLFKIVLGEKPAAHQRLLDLFNRFQQLEGISQRAVIARLLTTVAETLSEGVEARTPDGSPILPDDLEHLNQGKIFEIVVFNLLNRDENIGFLNASDRLRFLRSFAILLQQPFHHPFARPEEIRSLVGELFETHLRKTDTPQQMLENFYRACRRHSGLTTEGQFLDTSGNIDFPVDESDNDSNVGFSHNSLREFLVSGALADYLTSGTEYRDLTKAVVSDAVASFYWDIAEYSPDLSDRTRDIYSSTEDSRLKEILFKLIYQLVRRSAQSGLALLGAPVQLANLDLCTCVSRYPREWSGTSIRTVWAPSRFS